VICDIAGRGEEIWLEQNLDFGTDSSNAVYMLSF
jgi:hypothetical protein